jgi:diguanylate cyclase (GGDEF)-like protein
LIKVSKIIKETLRETDVVCRWGGEEIVALLPVVEKQYLVNIAEKVRLAVEGLYEPVRVTISIGCVYTEVQCELQALIDKADKALYQAKTNGRNQVVLAE